MIENLLQNYKQRKYLLIAIMAILCVFYLLAVYIVYETNKNNLYSNVDKILKSSAYAIDGIIDENFHDRAINKNSILEKEDKENIIKLSKYTDKVDIEYIYTMIQRDGKIYFTSSSATEDDYKDNQVTYFFDEYESATLLLKNLLKNNKIAFEEASDKWGTFRSVFIPMETKNGNRYILGADIEISYIESQLKKFLTDSLIMFMILAIAGIVIYFIRKRIESKELDFISNVESSLKDEIKLKTNELKQLNSSLELKVQEKTKELQTLNENLEKRVELEVEKNLHNEIRLLEQSKLASMGEMIGNIAHQWRQPLSVISTTSSGIQVRKEAGILTDEILNESTNIINENAQHLSKTIDTFRNFLLENKETKEVVIQDRIKKALTIVSTTLKNNHIELVNDIDYSNPIKIKLVLGELSQVLINIINNAKDALIETKTLKPWIKIGLEQYSDKVIITVEDNAGGIPNNVISQIFEPYFTTKHQSIGTGLGLYMSYKIITESLRGKLYINNSENGAKFFVELPL